MSLSSDEASVSAIALVDIEGRGRFLLSCFVVWLIVGVVGCSDPNFGQVTGMVTVDGNRVETGSIAFIPEAGQGPTAGAEIMEGAYSARVAKGRVKVEIRVPIKVGEKKLYNTPDSPVQPLLEEMLPPRFNDFSELRLEVEPGENEANFDLQIEP